MIKLIFRVHAIGGCTSGGSWRKMYAGPLESGEVISGGHSVSEPAGVGIEWVTAYPRHGREPGDQGDRGDNGVRARHWSVGAWFKEEDTVKCVICKVGETLPGMATVTLERDAMVLVFKGVPASICANCGEEYVDNETTSKLLQAADDAVRTGVQACVVTYQAN